MAKRIVPQRQFRGMKPSQPIQENTVDDREAASPSAQRKRMSLSVGSKAEANPGLVGKPVMKKRTLRGK